jgi:CBS-domain-containing membrane protein
MKFNAVIIKKEVDKDNIIIDGDEYGIIFYVSLLDRTVKQSDNLIGTANDIPNNINQYSRADINCMLSISKILLDKDNETLSLIVDTDNLTIYQQPELNVCGTVLEANLKKIIETKEDIIEDVEVTQNFEHVIRTLPMSKF